MADKPNKPTEEELKQKQQEALEAEETLEDENQESDPEVEEPSGVEEQESEEPEQEEEEQAEPSKELYKKKFSNSSRENQRINAKNRIINKAFQDAENIDEPTDDEMKSQYGEDWDLMSDVEKRLIKETETTKRWRAKIKEASDQATKVEKWAESVDEFIDDPKNLNENPGLEGKEEQFRDFATRDENNNVPFNILVSAFLYNESTKKVSNKGKMFENGSGGPKEVQRNDGMISLEEAMKLKRSDYPKYKEYLLAKKIKYDI